MYIEEVSLSVPPSLLTHQELEDGVYYDVTSMVLFEVQWNTVQYTMTIPNLVKCVDYGDNTIEDQGNSLITEKTLLKTIAILSGNKAEVVI